MNKYEINNDNNNNKLRKINYRISMDPQGHHYIISIQLEQY